MLTDALVLAALVAGLAGAWSPCGLSMVETLRPAGSRAAATGGAVAFAIGALVGGAVTFGGLALLGTALGATGAGAAAVAAALLLMAAVGDGAGRRIVPQVRRQVPESWRRILPLPLACALYGVLLGLGFTTFVLSYATWGLAAAALAIGGPGAGLAVGLAFGLGRALPVLWLAPRQDSGRAAAVLEAMGERPDVLRGLRLAAAAGLAVAAVALVIAPPAARAAAATTFQTGAADPGAGPAATVWQAADRSGRLLRPDGSIVGLPGTDPAVGDALIAWRLDQQIVVADLATLTPLRVVDAPGGDAVGLSDQLLAWRAPTSGGRDRIHALSLVDAASTPVLVRSAGRGGSLGRPAVAGTSVLFDDQTPARSRILAFDAARGSTRTLRSARDASLLNPSARDGRLLYVRSGYTRQRLELGRLAAGDGRADRDLASTTPTARRDIGREPGHHDHRAGYGRKGPPQKAPRPPAGRTVTWWTTALAPDAALVTRVRHEGRGATSTSILRVGL